MLAVSPPVAPMLARLASELPTGDDYVYEPKWDGFRCLAFCDASNIDLRSRHDRPFSRYFPEVVAALREPGGSVVLDGEVVATRNGVADFAALMARLHPAASRVARLAAETPAQFIAFDVLAVGGDDVREEPFTSRRGRLEAIVGGGGAPAPIRLSPLTGDAARAREWLLVATAEIDGVVAKRRGQRYEPGRRALVKVKRERTADCVVAGFRFFGSEVSVGSLLLGCYDGATLRHVGVVTSFRATVRRGLIDALKPYAIRLDEHPWRHGFALEGGPMGRLRGAAARWTPDMPLDWIPLRPELVVEVAYTRTDGIRFRHPAQFRRWRPDREPASCGVDQLIEDSRR